MRVQWAVAIAAIMVAISGGVSSAGSQQPPPAPTLRAPPPLPLFGAPTPPPNRGPADQDCGNDALCRLEAIDARLARIERTLARGGGGGSGGVSIAVGQYCRRDECPALAAQACVTAGFARGGADEMDTSTNNPLIIRAVCFD